MSLTAEQIELRKHGIGGSEQGILAGVSSRMMATELYFRKRGDWTDPDQEDTFFADMGHASEAPLAAYYEREKGVKLYNQRTTRFHPDPDLKFLIGHSDRLIRGDRKKGVEFKMRVSFNGWGFAGTDDVPDDVMLQCQQYMMIKRADSWDVLAFLGGRDRRIYTIGADRGIQDGIVSRSIDFWTGVQLGNPPPIDYEHETSVRFLHELYPGADGTQVTLPEEATSWIEVYEKSGKRIKDLETTRRAARAQIEDFMGPAAVAFFPDKTKSVTRKRVNSSDPDRAPQMRLNIRNVAR